GVANDGTVFVRTDTAGAINAGRVVRLGLAARVTDTDLGTPVQVNGAAAQWFQLSPDGTWIAATASRNLSAYTILGGVLGAEDKLETGALSKGFGIANDNRIYELTLAGTLLQWTPAVSGTGQSSGAASTIATVNSSVGQWVLGPNGQVAYLQGPGT